MFTCFTFFLLCSLGKVVNVHVIFLVLAPYILPSCFLPIDFLHATSILLFFFTYRYFLPLSIDIFLVSFRSVSTIILIGDLLLSAVFCCVTFLLAVSHFTVSSFTILSNVISATSSRIGQKLLHEFNTNHPLG